MSKEKKFLDYEGVKYLWSKINMQDYPNNQTLIDVINAIDETKADKNELAKYLDTTGDIMTGPLGLTYNINYGQNFPDTNNIGEIFFLEDTTSNSNDYAEYRICLDDFIPGQVVCENGDDTLSISTERLQPGANIISDTFGYIIGEDKKAKCPIAVSGRVLAYTYEPREEFKAGDAVCAGPNGTVSKMTREEIREYPERIIGTVSAIPNYEHWGDGDVPINGRIWIKVK